MLEVSWFLHRLEVPWQHQAPVFPDFTFFQTLRGTGYNSRCRTAPHCWLDKSLQFRKAPTLFCIKVHSGPINTKNFAIIGQESKICSGRSIEWDSFKFDGTSAISTSVWLFSGHRSNLSSSEKNRGIPYSLWWSWTPLPLHFIAFASNMGGRCNSMMNRILQISTAVNIYGMRRSTNEYNATRSPL